MVIYPFNTGCLPLSYSGNPGVSKGRILQGWVSTGNARGTMAGSRSGSYQVPPDLMASSWNLSLPRRVGGGLDGTTGVFVNVPCSDPLAAMAGGSGAVPGAGCVWWQPPDWADSQANPPQLSQDRYGE